MRMNRRKCGGDCGGSEVCCIGIHEDCDGDVIGVDVVTERLWW